MANNSYPITTPYGKVPGYPLNNGFHNGIDYGYPMGTPVIVNGVTIGISGATGAAYDAQGSKGTPGAAHLHLGKFVNGAAQNPGVGNGFSFNSAKVYDTGSDPTNGNFVRITGDGALWNYLHLGSINVTKGQLLEGEDMARIQELEDLANNRQSYLDRIGGAVSVGAPVDGNGVNQIINNIKVEQNRIDELTRIVGDLEHAEGSDKDALIAELQAVINKHK